MGVRGGDAAERGDALLGALHLGNVALAALHENSWRVVGMTIDDEKMPGLVPGGVVVFDRGHSPNGNPAESWGTAEWAAEGGIASTRTGAAGIRFFTGHYDLTREEAFADFAKRSERRR